MGAPPRETVSTATIPPAAPSTAGTMHTWSNIRVALKWVLAIFPLATGRRRAASAPWMRQACFCLLQSPAPASVWLQRGPWCRAKRDTEGQGPPAPSSSFKRTSSPLGHLVAAVSLTHFSVSPWLCILHLLIVILKSTFWLCMFSYNPFIKVFSFIRMKSHMFVAF